MKNPNERAVMLIGLFYACSAILGLVAMCAVIALIIRLTIYGFC